jgi:hypothetical protein
MVCARVGVVSGTLDDEKKVAYPKTGKFRDSLVDGLESSSSNFSQSTICV